jgi:hypothetical protein
VQHPPCTRPRSASSPGGMRNAVVDRIFLHGVAGLGAVAACVVQHWRKRRRLPGLGKVVGAFLSGQGVVIAAWQIWRGLIPSGTVRLMPDIDELRGGFVLSGVISGWISIVALTRCCRPPCVPTSPRTKRVGGSSGLIRQTKERERDSRPKEADTIAGAPRQSAADGGKRRRWGYRGAIILAMESDGLT